VGPVTLSFTAPGDDGVVGTAAEYDLRWSNAPIDAGNFNGANPLATDPPQVSGTIETTTINGLPSGTLYFAVKARDEVASNWSGISNVLTVVNP